MFSLSCGGASDEKYLRTSHFSDVCDSPAHLILFDMTTATTSGKQQNSKAPHSRIFLRPTDTPSLLDPTILPSTLL
jgi:hypothetical protein